MKTDVIVLGAELDALLAAARLLECGHSVALLSSGAGAMHYAPAGVHVLGYTGPDGGAPVVVPDEAIARLERRHPYRMLGRQALGDALAWFAGLCDKAGQPVDLSNRNAQALTPAGLFVPVAGVTPHLATQERCTGRVIGIVTFDGTRDFPCALLKAELDNRGETVHVINAPLPGQTTENAALALSFDRLDDPAAYFAALGETVPEAVDLLLFPAVLGLRTHLALCECAQRVLGRPVYEVPTLPTSVPGLRLMSALREMLEARGAPMIGNFAFEAAEVSPQRIVVHDRHGRSHHARVAILATGGVLMGGLEVSSDGQLCETFFDLPVWQSHPLAADSASGCLDALHRAGVETDDRLNPQSRDGSRLRNLFVTGQTLAHCNPATESSAEGISAVTGWSAAEAARACLKEMTHA